MVHALTLCGILMFGIGGFILISGWDSAKPSLITRIGASALLVVGVGLFVTGIFGEGWGLGPHRP